MNFLLTTWAGNTFLRWAITAIILLALPLVVRVVNSALGRPVEPGGNAAVRGRWLSSIAAGLRRPIALLVWVAGLWLIKREVLTLPGWMIPWADRLVYAGLVIGSGLLLSRLADAGVDGYLTRAAERRGGQIDGLLIPLFRGGTRFLVWTVVLVWGLDNAGYQLSAILGGLGLGGLAVAMAAKDLIADILGGATIMLNRPFTVGDKIMFKGQWTTVRSFGLRTTTLEDFSANYKVVVPNSYFISNEVTNISDHPGNMILMNIRLSLATSADQLTLALSLVQDILQGHAEVRYIWSKLDHFDDYASTLRIHYDILEFRNRIRVKSEINLAIVRAFQSNGIKFAAMPVRAIASQEDVSPFVG